MPGDVAAYPLPGHSTYTGHSGIITQCECQAGYSNIGAHEFSVYTDPTQFIDDEGLLFRRYTGD
jgi:hypothetical protein